MNEIVDVFIPVAFGNTKKFPAALYSAITQTYANIRIVLFLDHDHSGLEAILDKWWYTLDDTPRENMVLFQFKNFLKQFSIEKCQKGIICRNPNGPSGSAAVGRQWIFEWPDKSPLVKMLDSDDILTPECIQYMMAELTPDCDGVLCPLFRASSCRHNGIITGKLALGHMGSGSVLMRKESMDRVISEGFEWQRKAGHDKEFIIHCIEKGYKFNTTKERNLLYLYLKS